MPNNEDIYAGRLQANNDSLEASRDVTELLPGTTDTQTQKLAELEALLEGKAGYAIKPNVFVQTTEPSKKNGIWLQTDKEFDKIVIDEFLNANGTWTSSGFAESPRSFLQGASAIVSHFIYLFSNTYNYRYDILTNTFERMEDVPIHVSFVNAVSIGTDIYIFGTNYFGEQKKAYKYDTLNDSWTQLADIPINYYWGRTAAIGTNIYLMGSHSGDNNNYKYDTLTNTYESMTNLPVTFIQGSSQVVGNYIYFFGGNYTKRVMYRYNTLTDTYTQLANSPVDFINIASAVVGNYIFILGGGNSSTSDNTRFYVYDISNNTYTKLTDIPTGFTTGLAESYTNKVFAISDRIQAYTLSAQTTYPDKSIVISQGQLKTSSYKIELVDMDYFVNQPKYAVNDVSYYTTADGLDNTIPTYYGDGTQWIKFKN